MVCIHTWAYTQSKRLDQAGHGGGMRRQRQADLCEFQAGLVHRASSYVYIISLKIILPISLVWLLGELAFLKGCLWASILTEPGRLLTFNGGGTGM